jgi:hypothetical protein
MLLPAARGASLPALERLSLPGAGLGDYSAAALLAASMPRLRELDLSGNRLTERGLAEVLASPAAAGAATLRLGRNKLGEAATCELALAPMRALVSLSLDAQRLAGGDAARGLTDEAVAQLARAPWFGQLTCLDLSSNLGLGRDPDVWDDICRETARTRSMRRLSLEGCANFTRDGARALACWPGLAAVHGLPPWALQL